MQRLTKREGKHTIRIRNEWRRHDIGWDKLADYEDLEDQGLLIKLPCRVGDIVYLVRTYGRSDTTKKVMRRIEEIPFTVVWLDDIGKTVFLTKKEAEAKLREMEAEE